ncbi:MAG: ATP-dependent Clp protease proteolytic subunit [Phascolarctobacterium sp.]|nr:ATP-dependent Clp protease proteolytic subunit [Phascolarctobacterium sp.]
MWPSVIVKEDNGMERNYDLVSRLLKDRIILVAEEINTDSAMSIIAQILYLESVDTEAPITMYINSPGGSISDGMAIYDVMNKVKCPIITVCTGMAASMGAFLLSSGSKGQRFCLPNSTVMIHQPLGGVQGQATEIEIVARRILKLREKIYTIISKNCNRSYESIARACERDNYLDPEEALKMGIVDAIIDCPPKAYSLK